MRSRGKHYCWNPSEHVNEHWPLRYHKRHGGKVKMRRRMGRMIGLPPFKSWSFNFKIRREHRKVIP